MTSEEIELITNKVVEQIKSQYLLVERNAVFDNNLRELRLSADNQFIENALNIACKFWEINKSEVMAGLRSNKSYRLIPHVTAYVCRLIPKVPITYGNIGHFFKKDHSTIIHRVMLVENKMKKNTEYAFLVKQYIDLVKKSIA
jgi:chromosomal replication initiation ATPase DnaA